MLRLTFHGAAETVTGSKYLLETDDARVLFDCGMFQGKKELRLRNWHRLPFDAGGVDAVVLTHAHIDHIGYLPKFVNSGFRNVVYATGPTVDLCEIQLLDSARTQERDAEDANRHGYSKHHPALPLYDVNDVARTLKLLRAVERKAWFNAAGSVWCRYHDAGHLLGSSMIEVEIRSGSQPVRLLFSGDVGRYGAPLYFDPTPPPPCDYLICESTYGDRDHAEISVLDQLAGVVTDSISRGGVLVSASFAVGRAHQLIYLLRVLMQQGRVPEIPIFLDSPMAVRAMKVFIKYASEHDLCEARLGDPEKVLSARNVHLCESVQDSKAINDEDGPAVIIASSGMMVGGRILHHMKRRLPDPRNTVVLGGYMAEGTRGRDIKEGRRTLRIHGQYVLVRAHVAELSAMSGHAGRSELLQWLSPLAAPRRTFMTHGEPAGAIALADTLRADRGWDVVLPKHGESFELGSVY